MAMIALLSPKGSPGVTTSVAMLADVWPAPVIVADADPAGGDLATGWLAEHYARGMVRPDRSILSFAIDTQYEGDVGPHSLERHLQEVAGRPNCRLLAGVGDPTRAKLVPKPAWRRLAQALARISKPGSAGADVLVDCGRFGSDTPLTLLSAADLVVIVVRPKPTYTQATRGLVAQLRTVVEPDRLGLAVCRTSSAAIDETQQRIGVRVAAALPDDPRVARCYSDGHRPPLGLRHRRLFRAAVQTAARLHVALNSTGSPDVQPTRHMTESR